MCVENEEGSVSGRAFFFFGVVSHRLSIWFVFFLNSQRLSRDSLEGSNFFELIRSLFGLESFSSMPISEKNYNLLFF